MIVIIVILLMYLALEIMFSVHIINIYQHLVEAEIETQSAKISAIPAGLQLRMPTANELLGVENGMATSTPQEVKISNFEAKIDDTP